MTIQDAVESFSLDPIALAQRFGARTLKQIAGGKDVSVTAGLAFHFAGQVIDAQPKVIGRITPECPWGDSPVCYVSDADYQQHWTR